MFSQGDQLLNQLKQYDARKNQFRSNSSSNLSNQINTTESGSPGQQSNFGLVNNKSSSNFDGFRVYQNTDTYAIRSNAIQKPLFSMNDDIDGDEADTSSHIMDDTNVNPNSQICKEKEDYDGLKRLEGTRSDLTSNDYNNDSEALEPLPEQEQHEFKLLGNNSIVTRYEDTNHEIVQHTYTSLKILDRKPRFVPPINFGVVENDIYRSGHPQPNNFEFLKTLNLKTIIYLGDKTDNYDYYKWIKENNDQNERKISFRFFKMQPPSSFSDKNHAFNDEVALNTILNIVLNKDNYPILIHSNKGKHRVGVLVGLIRRFLQGWSLSGTFDEYGKFARDKGEGDLEFIEMFRPILKLDTTTMPSFVRVD